MVESLKIGNMISYDQLIKKNSENIREWYKTKVIDYWDKDVPRVCVLKHSYELIIKNLSDKKYINQLFLYEE